MVLLATALLVALSTLGTPTRPDWLPPAPPDEPIWPMEPPCVFDGEEIPPGPPDGRPYLADLPLYCGPL